MSFPSYSKDAFDPPLAAFHALPARFVTLLLLNWTMGGFAWIIGPFFPRLREQGTKCKAVILRDQVLYPLLCQMTRIHIIINPSWWVEK